MGRTERLGRYQLLSRLGAGGMAVVYRAQLAGPHRFERPVVIKSVRPELAADPKFIAMFLREARLSAQLHHRGIVQVQELGNEDGEYFLVMELVDGHDLGALIEASREQTHPLPLGAVCFIVSEVAAALHYAHQLRDEHDEPLEIVHRDVSPSNVMLSTHSGVKLLDFGIAKAREAITDEKTRTGTLKGKLRYFSPEQARGAPLDGRSDLFSLGIVLYECLTLVAPFRAADERGLLDALGAAEVLPPTSLRPEVPAELEAICMRLLARQPEERFPDGAALVRALAPLIHRFGGGPSEVARLLTELGTTLPAERVDSRLDLRRTRAGAAVTPRRGRGTGAMIAVGALGAIALGAGAVHHARSVAPAPPPAARAEEPRVETPPVATPPPQPPPTPIATPPATPAPAKLRSKATPLRRRDASTKPQGGDSQPAHRSPDIHSPFEPR